MKQGDTLNGYRIVTEPTNQSGGNCVWAFAEKNRKRWFIKEFLTPKYPTPGSPGSERSKENRRRICEAFEARHRRVMDVLDPRAPGGGNLVAASDFFRCESTYYKVTEPVHPTPVPRLHETEPRKAGVVVRTLALSLKLLHDQGIVHGDLKPNNILIETVSGSSAKLATSRLIDFDDSYFRGEPPGREALGGDPRYAAPEWFLYKRDDPMVSASAMTCAGDVFALALVVHFQLTGAQPVFDETAHEGCPGLAVLAGRPLTLSPDIHPRLRRTLTAMLHVDPRRRPTVRAVTAALADNAIFAPYTGPPEPDPGAPDGVPGSRIRSSVGRRRTPPAVGPPAAAPAADAPTSRIRKNFRPPRP